MKKTEATMQINHEYRRASDLYPPFNSEIEGLAIIQERVDKLIAATLTDLEPYNARKRAVQVAAMALRFLIDCT